MSTLVVNEIFHSIQGESSFAGRPCVFVRLTFCNLRCTYCDTEYAFHEGVPLELEEIIHRVREFNCGLVEVTGGEPLAQSGTTTLLQTLCEEGYETLLETGGSLSIAAIDPRVLRIVDFKCPSSGMAKKNLWSNVEELRGTDEVKFVIGDREDFDWAVEMINIHGIRRCCPVLMSVVYGMLSPLELAEWILKSRVDVRFQLQMHKYIWSPELRGV